MSIPFGEYVDLGPDEWIETTAVGSRHRTFIPRVQPVAIPFVPSMPVVNLAVSRHCARCGLVCHASFCARCGFMDARRPTFG